MSHFVVSELYDIFSRPENFKRNAHILVAIIYDSIGWDKFSSVIDLKYIEVSSHYIGVYSTASGRFSNDIWEFNLPCSSDFGPPEQIANIKLKGRGSFDFFKNSGDQAVLERWLNYFKNQCKESGITFNE